jgi:hypothetical protein
VVEDMNKVDKENGMIFIIESVLFISCLKEELEDLLR